MTDLMLGAGPVTVVDPGGVAPPRAEVRLVAEDALDGSPAVMRALTETDVLVLALPAPALSAAAGALAPHLPEGALLVDTTVTKSEVAATLAAVAGDRLEALSLGLMFAPSLGFSGRSAMVVPVTPATPGRRGRALVDLLVGVGARVVTVSPERHDALAGGVQVATHAALLGLGVALRQLDLDPAELLAVATPPHRALLALLARLTASSPHALWDIQQIGGGAARTALADGHRSVADAACGRVEDLSELLAGLQAWLGPTGDQLRGAAAEMLA